MKGLLNLLTTGSGESHDASKLVQALVWPLGQVVTLELFVANILNEFYCCYYI